MRYSEQPKHYRAPQYHNSAARNSQPYAVQLRARLLELQAMLTEVDDTLRPSLTQRIAVLSARMPESKGELCTPQLP